MSISSGRLSSIVEWHFLDEVVKVIEEAVGGNITERHVLKLGLAGRIRLGIFCPERICARRANFVDLSGYPTTPEQYLKSMKDRELESFRSLHPLDLIGVPLESFVRTLALDDGRIISLDDDIKFLDGGIFELTMIGDEIADVKNMLSQRSDQQIPSEGKVGHRFISATGGQTYHLAEFRSLPAPAIYHGGDFYPARTLPAGSSIVVSHQAISDFLDTIGQTIATESKVSHTQSKSKQDPLFVFREMGKLRFSEVSLAFVGEKDNYGATANTLLEISARGQLRRVTLGQFGLADRRTGNLNKQAVVLIGLASSQTFRPTSNQNTKTVSRIRELLQERLGLSEDPFHRPNDTYGWQPKFSVTDQRGKADDRAREKAERTIVSLNEQIERGRQFTAPGQEDIEDDEEGSTEAWLQLNDPNR